MAITEEKVRLVKSASGRCEARVVDGKVENMSYPYGIGSYGLNHRKSRRIQRLCE